MELVIHKEWEPICWAGFRLYHQEEQSRALPHGVLLLQHFLFCNAGNFPSPSSLFVIVPKTSEVLSVKPGERMQSGKGWFSLLSGLLHYSPWEDRVCESSWTASPLDGTNKIARVKSMSRAGIQLFCSVWGHQYKWVMLAVVVQHPMKHSQHLLNFFIVWFLSHSMSTPAVSKIMSSRALCSNLENWQCCTMCWPICEQESVLAWLKMF